MDIIMKISKKLIVFLTSSVFLLVAVAGTFLFILNGDFSFSKDNGMSQQNIVINGEQRIFYIHCPPEYKNEKDKKFPLVMLFHGTVADANKIKNYTKFNDFADKNGFIVVYPEYTGVWDWDLKPAAKSKEVQFTSQIIDDMVKNYNVNPSMVYQAGYSSGAEMSYILSCALSSKIAAFAPVAGNIRQSYANGCSAQQLSAFMLVHGTADPYEKWEGNPKKEMLSVDDTLNFLKKKNSCSSKETITQFPKGTNANSTSASLVMDNSCKNNSEVSILKIDGGGHTWPGSTPHASDEPFLGKTNQDVSANEVIWEFFKRHKINQGGTNNKI